MHHAIPRLWTTQAHRCGRRWLGRVVVVLMFFLSAARAAATLVAEHAAVVDREVSGGSAQRLLKNGPQVARDSRAFSELKLYDVAGRPWRSPIEDWVGAQARVQADRAWKNWLVEEEAEVDAWMARFPRDRVDWAGGYWHAFVSPKDGSTLTWTMQVPMAEAAYLSSPSDPHVVITQDLFEAWVCGYRGRNVNMIRRASSLYRLTGEVRYAEWASVQLDYYAENYYKWRSRAPNLGAHLTWQPLDEAILCSAFAASARLLSTYAGPERLSRWKQGLFDPIVAVLDQHYLRIQNIALWCRSIAAEVALVFHDDAAWRRELNGEFGVRALFAQGVTKDYLWYEQSLGYNTFVVVAAMDLFTTAGLYGRSAELAPELCVGENLLLAPIYLRFPDGRLPHPADETGSSMRTWPDVGLFKAAYRVFPTVIGLREASGAEGRGWDTLLDPPIMPTRSVVLPTVVTRNLAATRMAVLAAGGWQVFFHYGQLTPSHAKPEALTYEAAWEKVDVTHNTGVVGYMSPFNFWFRSSLNQNVPLIDGLGEDGRNPGELLEYSAGIPRIAAAQSYGLGGRAERTLEIRGSELIDTVRLSTKEKKLQSLGLAVHTQGRVRLSRDFLRDDELAKRSKAFGYWRDVTVAAYRNRAEFEVDYGSVVLHLTIAVKGAFRVWHGLTPDQPVITSGQRESLYVELDQPTSAAVFVTKWKAPPPPTPLAAPASLLSK